MPSRLSRRSFLAVAGAAPLAGGAASALRLWYRQPAPDWNAALPVGNGRLGAMVFGGVAEERLQLNEDTLWSGFPQDGHPTPDPGVLEEIRRLVLREQRYVEADALARQFQGPFNESYMPLADLSI